MTKDEERAVKFKVRILKYADEIDNISKACRNFGIPRSIFYVWRIAFRISGEESLHCRKRFHKLQARKQELLIQVAGYRR